MSRRIVILVASLSGLVVPLAQAQDAPAPSTETGSPVEPAATTPATTQAQPAQPQPAQPQPAQAQPAQPQPSHPQPTYGSPQPRYQAQGYYPQPQGYYYGATPRHHRPRIVGYRTEQREARSLWVPGLITFAVGYVLNLAITPLANALSSDRDTGTEEDAWAWSLLPVVGPMVQLGLGAPHPAIPIATGLLQLGGLTLFIAGLATTEEVRVPIYEGDADAPTQVSVGVAPTAGGAQVGLTVRHL